MDEQINKIWVCTYNGALLSPEKEGNPVTCYNMVELWGYYAKVNKPLTQKYKQCMISLSWGIWSS